MRWAHECANGANIGRAGGMSTYGKHLLHRHQEMLAASAVTQEVAGARGYRSIAVKADLERLGFGRAQRRVPGLLIPIHNVAGEIETYQYRPDEPRMNDKGKAVKYETKTGSRMVLDVPANARPDIGDPSIPLFITEGAKKADAAVSKRLCCVALLGVWNFRGTNTLGGKVALPDWESVALNDRAVYIVFDSDVATKSAVAKAMRRLKGFLDNRGAKTRIVYLPAGSGGEKVGLDDYLAAGHGVDDLMRISSDDVTGADDDEPTCPYRTTEHGIIWLKPTHDGDVLTPLTNFAAEITADITEDDGAEVRRAFHITTRLNGCHRTFRVPVERFGGMAWAVEHLGAGAILYPGATLKDHARVAVQMLSGDVSANTVFTHLGWRKIDDDWLYLHTGGSIGPNGPVPEISVMPGDGRLAHYELPSPPEGEVLRRAVRASLSVLELAPKVITYPVLAAAYRAPLAEASVAPFSIFVAGPTGCQKTEITAIAQAHHGATFDGKNLPGNWHTTANTLEKQAFLAKDCLFAVDDFAPGGTTADVQRLHRDADRLFRAQGNRAGRGRMRPDGSLRPEYFPRGLIISSGEDVPHGQSIRARLLILEVSPGDVDLANLTKTQSQAADGVYAQAMSGYIRWLAPQIDELKKLLPARQQELRAQARSNGVAHDRTPDITASLFVGLETFLRFAAETGAVEQDDCSALLREGWDVLREVAAKQASHQASEDPARRFIELLGAAIASRQVHLADPKTNDRPSSAADWGWRSRPGSAGTTEWIETGTRIGWVEGEDIYLDPDATFAAVQRLAREQGNALAVTQRTLLKRLSEKGLLASQERAAGRNTVRKEIAGRRRRVLHISSKVLCSESGPNGPSGPHPSNSSEFGTDSVDRLSEDVEKAVQENGPHGPENKGFGPNGPIGPEMGDKSPEDFERPQWEVEL